MTPPNTFTADDEQLKNLRGLIRDTLSLFVGHGRRFEADAVGAACCKTGASIHSYLRGNSVPDLPTGILLMGAMPVEFASAILRPAGLTGLRRLDGETTPAETLREVLEGASALAAALADGRIDHTERPRVRRELNEAMVAIAQFLAAMEA